MFLQHLTVWVESSADSWKLKNIFFFYHVTGEGFDLNFIVTVKRIILLYREAQYCLNLL